MKDFTKILCPVDFSEVSRQALQYAKAFSENFESELTLLHVSPDMSAAYTALMPDFPTFGTQEKTDLVSELNGFADDWAGKLKKVIRTGMPDTEILKYADKHPSDLIIIGAKGHSKFERFFLGSVGEKVVRNSDVPVLAVHSKPKGLPIKRILVPIDFSALSNTVLPTVANLAKKFKAEIYLLHIVEMGQYVNTEGQVKEYDYFERIKERLEEQWQLPREFNKIEIKKFIRHHIGSAGYGILEFAQDWDIDLIVMATHGSSGLSKVLMGSVAEKVSRIAPCPVLSMRSRVQAEKSERHQTNKVPLVPFK